MLYTQVPSNLRQKLMTNAIDVNVSWYVPTNQLFIKLFFLSWNSKTYVI